MNLRMEDLVSLALEVTGLTRESWNALLETMKSDAAMNLEMKKDWTKSPRESEAAIREYYRASDIWFVNTFNNGAGALLSIASGSAGAHSGWSKKLIELMKVKAPVGRILDYGGGFFKDSWPLVASGYRVEVAEVRGPVTELMKRFISRHHLEDKVGVIEVDNETPITGMYDAIICFETLEHVLHPEALTFHLREHLRPGGPFAFSTTFGAPEHAPYHVASNAPLGDWSVWSAILRKIGFIPRWDDPEGSSARIWEAAS